MSFIRKAHSSNTTYHKGQIIISIEIVAPRHARCEAACLSVGGGTYLGCKSSWYPIWQPRVTQMKQHCAHENCKGRIVKHPDTITNVITSWVYDVLVRLKTLYGLYVVHLPCSWYLYLFFNYALQPFGLKAWFTCHSFPRSSSLRWRTSPYHTHSHVCGNSRQFAENRTCVSLNC
jgi:hypothetical protein